MSDDKNSIPRIKFFIEKKKKKEIKSKKKETLHYFRYEKKRNYLLFELRYSSNLRFKNCFSFQDVFSGEQKEA